MQELTQGWKLLGAGDVFEHRGSYIVNLNNVEYHTLLMKTVDDLTVKIVANGNQLVLLFPDGDYITDSEENNLGRLMHYADEYLVNEYWRKCHEQGNSIDNYEMVNIDECKAAEIEKIKESQEKTTVAGKEVEIIRAINDIKADIKSLMDRVCALESRGQSSPKGDFLLNS